MLLPTSGFGPASDDFAVNVMACFSVAAALPGNIQLPDTLSLNDTICMPLRIARFNLVFAFCASVMANITAVFFHALVRRNGVFEAMAPVRCRATGVFSRRVGPANDRPSSSRS